MAGIGKTTLAVHLAHLLTYRYPDAQLFVDLRGHDPDRPAVDPMSALDTLLRALGVPGERIPAEPAERAALWRAELATRRALVVLDDAADAAQVRPLLPGTHRALTLITSRRRMVDLETARVLSLDLLPHRDAVALFTTVVSDDRPANEPDVVDEVVELCGRLPLALRIAAARLRSRPTWTVRHLAQRLRQGLGELSVGDRSVAATFALSHDHLTTEQRRLFRLLGLVPGTDFDTFAAAALAGIREAEADRVLEELVDVHLLEQPTPSRYQFHDLLREHARAVTVETESDAERAEAVARLFDYYLHTSTAAGGHLGSNAPEPRIAYPPANAPEFTDGGEALAWLGGEHVNLVSAVLHAADHGPHAHAWELTQALWRFYFIRGHVDDWITTHRAALRAARALADPFAEAEVLKSLGTAHWQARKLPEALRCQHLALDLMRELADRDREGQVLANIGQVLSDAGRHAEALEHVRQALVITREVGDRTEETNVLNVLGEAHRAAGLPSEADHQLALANALDIGDRYQQAHAHVGIGHAVAPNDPEAARLHWELSLAIYRELGVPEADEVAAHLAERSTSDEPA
ncbi:MAG: tetratricopeptide repeat protein [Umezawaea sp.]